MCSQFPIEEVDQEFNPELFDRKTVDFFYRGSNIGYEDESEEDTEETDMFAAVRKTAETVVARKV